ncbi:uncharacterized protein SCHCODRAFT_02520535 [Schizophyllum commune H4-8]|nr:uncharacterized protein SCHCODRAFT_02520535 [Schizophyllum commune H4-8]KAI5885263.1 hypothetical protein SCHCODRAFT_02520535 [Schizophyllum commune H4-8]
MGKMPYARESGDVLTRILLGVLGTVIRDLTLQDVDRVRLYASFIRDLEFHKTFVGVRPDSLENIAAAIGGSSLLPNLRRLAYSGPSEWSNVLHLLMPSVLTDFTFSIHTSIWNDPDAEDIAPEDGEHEISAITALKSGDGRSLIKLDLTWPRRFPSLGQMLQGWRSLKDLRLTGVVDAAALCAIIDLPQIETLTFVNCDMHAPGTLPADFRMRHSLRTLCIHGANASWAVWFLEALGRVELDQLKLTFPELRLTPSLRHICQTIEKHCSKDLQIITIGECEPSAANGAGHNDGLLSYSIDDILPLLKFPALWLVSIELHGQLALWDKDIFTMAQAWPTLEQLTLRGVAVPRPTCTLTSLLILAHFTPAICRVVMNVDATTIDALNEALSQSPGDAIAAFSTRSLTTFCVLDSPIDSELAVASFLSRFFPSLKEIYCQAAEDAGAEVENRRRRKWAEVAKALPYFLEARATGMHGPVGLR